MTTASSHLGRRLGAVLLVFAPFTAAAQQTGSERAVTVASKPFGESYLLAEMFAQLLESRGIAVERRPGLGATEVAFAALRSGAIDVYPEYTGTGLIAILRDTAAPANSRDAYQRVTRRFADAYGMRWLAPLGFENTYAVAVREETATRYGLRTISDLARASGRLRAGFTSDFIGRPDGLPGLRRAYGLKFADVRPLAPALKYVALAEGSIDVIDGYSTDGLLSKYRLVTLEDDRGFFPPYDAAALLGARVSRDRPDVIAALTLLSNQLDVARMRDLNRRVEVEREDVAVVARDALAAVFLDADPTTRSAGIAGGRRSIARIGALAAHHLLLVAVALAAAILIAVPLGLFVARHPRLAEPATGALGILQTIPSIALLAFMIPLFGVGVTPALIALVLYALYPIARNTYAGVRDADPDAVRAAEALGATSSQRLWWIQLPLAVPVIMSGIRTSAVITVGAATLAAFIGAGGLGEPIVEGLALADSRLILSGALPAAGLALVVDGALALLERHLRPAHLR